MRYALARLMVLAAGCFAVVGCAARVDSKWSSLPPLSQEPETEQDPQLQKLKDQVSQSPRSKTAMVALAGAFQERGRESEAAKAYQLVLYGDPLDDSAAAHLLEETQVRGVLPTVVADLCGGILAQDKKNRGALWVLGELLLQRNQMGQAQSLLEQAWEQQPRYWRPALSLARLAAYQLRPQEALQWCGRAEETAPDTSEAKAQVATLYLDAGQIDRGLTAARAAAALGPRYPLPQTILARALLAARRPAEAAEAAQRAIGLAPQIPAKAPPPIVGYFATKQCERYWLLGGSYVQLGRWQEAQDALAKAVDESRGAQVPAEANIDAARTYQRLGDQGKAIEQYRRAIEKGIGRPEAYNDLAYLYAEDGHHLDEALAAAQAAVDLAPGGPTHDTLGWVQYQRGDYRAAVKNLAMASTEQPGEPEILHHLGLAYVRVGKAAEAGETLTKALQLAQGDDPASLALRSKIELDLQRREIRDATKRRR